MMTGHLVTGADAATAHQILSTLNNRIESSWRRCEEEYRIDREGGSPEIRVLAHRELYEMRQRAEEFVRVASGGVHTLSRQLSHLGYLVMLVDKSGTALNVLQSCDAESDYRKLGLIAGAQWDERRNGTSGVGTSLVDRRSVLVHRDEHFLRDMSVLSCSASPIFDGNGDVVACLNATSLYRSHEKEKELVTFQLVKLISRMIENAYFRHCYRDYYLLSISYDHMHCNDVMGALIAVDENGTVVAANQVARDSELWPWGQDICGKLFSQLEVMNFDDFAHGGKNDFVANCKVNDMDRDLYIQVSHPVSVLGRVSVSKIADRASQAAISPAVSLANIHGQDEHLKHIVSRVRRVIDKDIPILITGETGTGKEVFAQAIHADSSRRHKPFVAMNCAAIPESLIESELFGYEAGSFTGAKRGGMKGKLLQAHQGTIFLDEIGDMPPALQTRLLRVLAEREVMPLGAARAFPLDVQVISATHQSLEEKIQSGEFRQDLFYRLNGMSVNLPPLRRRADVEFFIRQMFNLESAGSAVHIEPAAMQRLCDYSWPGNVRELKSAVRLALVFSDGEVVDEDCLPDYVNAQSQPLEGEKPSVDDELLSAKDELIESLSRNKWNIKEAAVELSISRSTIYRKMERYNIVPPNKSST